MQAQDSCSSMILSHHSRHDPHIVWRGCEHLTPAVRRTSSLALVTRLEADKVERKLAGVPKCSPIENVFPHQAWGAQRSVRLANTGNQRRISPVFRIGKHQEKLESRQSRPQQVWYLRAKRGMLDKTNVNNVFPGGWRTSHAAAYDPNSTRNRTTDIF